MSLTILDSIADITAHRDVRAVETSLLATLFEHVNCHRVSLIAPPLQAEDDWLELMVVSSVASRGAAHQSTESKIQWDYDLVLTGAAVDMARQCVARGKLVKAKTSRGVSYCLPVKEDDIVSSILLLEARAEVDDDWRILEAVVKIYCNYLYLLRESERDKLTGLHNRRTFDSKFQQLVNIQRRYHEGGEPSQRLTSPEDQAWLGIIDIDHFKGINDNFGHLYGDEILLLLSREMQDFFRRSDLLFRFGGEEFVVLLEPAQAGGAEKAFERFRQHIEVFRFPQVGQVTISIGYAPIDMAAQPTDVFGRADKALYYGKANGRNQVASYPDLIARQLLQEPQLDQRIDLF